MTQTLPCLHPNPGWTEAPAAIHPAAPLPHQVSDTVGKHCILELYGCDGTKLDDELFLRATITAAAKRAGATLLNLITHRFEPQGVTGLALLAESHISIHTWPESGYAAVDVFTCGDHTMPERPVPCLSMSCWLTPTSSRASAAKPPPASTAICGSPCMGNRLLLP